MWLLLIMLVLFLCSTMSLEPLQAMIPTLISEIAGPMELPWTLQTCDIAVFRLSHFASAVPLSHRMMLLAGWCR